MPVIRTGRKPVSIVQNPATGSFTAAPGRFAATGTSFTAGNYGPAIGAAAVRAAAGVNTTPSVTVFSGTPNVNFTQMVPGESAAQMQTRIDNATSLSTLKVWFPAGEYRVTTQLQLKASTEYRLATGPLRTSADTAIVKGSEVVTGFTQGTGADINKWFKLVQTQDFDANDNVSVVTDNPPAGSMMEAYFKNGAWLHPTAAKSTVANNPNLYWFDNPNNTVWLGFNPAAHTIERTRTQYWIFEVKAQNVTIRGGITEHAGYENIRLNGLNTGNELTNPDNPSGFTMIDHESRYARVQNLGSYGHAQGAGFGQFRVSNVTFTRCYLHHGARGNYVIAWGDNFDINQCESAFGNFLHYGARHVAPDSEMDKILFVTNVTISGLYSHDNDGAGTWPDTQVNTFVLAESVIENNYGSGIHYEDNNGAVIRYNYFSNNDRNNNQPSPYDGSVSGMPTLTPGFQGGAIFNSSSANVEVHHNWFNLDGQAMLNFRHDAGRTWRNEGFWFHDNLAYHTASANGFQYLITYRDSPDFPSLATSNNRWNFNTYHVRSAGRTNNGTATWFFAPSGQSRTFAQWQQGMAAAGVAGGSPASFHDPNSTLVADI